MCKGDPVTTWVIDLDGVMWRGRAPIPGSAAAVGRLLMGGHQVLFCTNNSAESGRDRAARLVDQGVPPGCDVVTSADAVAGLVRPGESVLCLGGPGLRKALGAVGAVVLDAGEPTTAGAPVDAVVVGLDRDVDYGRIDRAAAAVRSGARLLASNDDATFPGADGIHPGCGAILAAVRTASGAAGVVAGKPYPPMADLIRDRCPDGGVVVGDKAGTDGRLAEVLGWPFGLVLSGVTAISDLPVTVLCAAVAADLSDLVDAWPDPTGG
jgi:HAD superfamily hydrolase (TIGR01450 family)